MWTAVVVMSLGALELSNLPAEPQLAGMLWEGSAELQLQRAKVAQARGDYERSLLLPNPSLDLSANTLPIGPSNPVDLPSPATNVPNVAVGLSQLFELGKRGPRQETSRQALNAALYDAREALRQRYYDLQLHVGEIAAAQARIAGLTELAEGAHHLAEIQKARADKGDASSLDADRALLEEEKLSSTLGGEREHLIDELRACGEVVGSRCEPFADAAAAIAYLESTVPAAGQAVLEQRPDLLSLQASEQSARAAETLANRHAIPDPTVRVGYVRDQFVASGNQPNSLFVGLSLPLPFFDHGQADARAAAAAAAAVSRARERALGSARDALVRLKAQSLSIEARRAQVRDRALPLARDVAQRLDAAVARGAAAIQDLLLARATLVELTLDARDLDLAAFHSRVATARAGGASPTFPEELNP